MSDPQASVETPPDRRSARRGALLAVVAGVAILAALFVRYQSLLQEREEHSVEHRLRGCPDEAVGALGEVLASTPVEQHKGLLLRYADDLSPGLRYAAVDALGGLEDRSTAPAIERAFRDNASIVRQRAVEVLHTVDREKGVALLRTALRDEDQWVREAAALQLSVVLNKENRLPPEIAASLVAALDPEDEVVCRTAAHLLARFEKKPWRIRRGMKRGQQGEVVRRWREWWQTEGVRRLGAERATLPEAVHPSRRDPAPEWSARSLDGKRWSLRSQRGRVTLLHFWGTWCPACRQEMWELGRLYRKYHMAGLDIVALTIGDKDAGAVRKAARDLGADFAVGFAPIEVTEAYGHIHEVPVSILIDRQGQIRYRYEGERDYNTFASAVRRLLEP